MLNPVPVQIIMMKVHSSLVWVDSLSPPIEFAMPVHYLRKKVPTRDSEWGIK